MQSRLKAFNIAIRVCVYLNVLSTYHQPVRLHTVMYFARVIIYVKETLIIELNWLWGPVKTPTPESDVSIFKKNS